MSSDNSHERVNDILLGPLERPALRWFSSHLPLWVTPDVLTLIGTLGAIIILVGYVLSHQNAAFLWLASFGFFVNWFGDSLDGTVARYRKIERPKYGFFVDHTVDAFGQLLILTGLGLSPYVSFSAAALALIGYLLMSIYVYVDTFVSGVFKISFVKFGPTEVRAIAVIINAIFFFVGVKTVALPFGEVNPYDLILLAIAGILIITFLVSTYNRARELALLEEQKKTSR